MALLPLPLLPLGVAGRAKRGMGKRLKAMAVAVASSSAKVFWETPAAAHTFSTACCSWRARARSPSQIISSAMAIRSFSEDKAMRIWRA